MPGQNFYARSKSLQHFRWNAGLLAAAAFVGAIALAQLLLPEVNEVPDQFPAVVLWRFRIVALGMQAILWSTLGLLFGAVAEQVLSKQDNFVRAIFGR